MEKLRKEIKRIKKHRLEYYEGLLDATEVYLDEKPDITIETCKSIIEGISKLIIHLLKQEPLRNLDSNYKLSELFKMALAELEKDNEFFDSTLVKRLGSAIHYLGELRNAHGDISHGRTSLKAQVNDADLAEMVVGMTDSIVTYMLKKLDQRTQSELIYEENEEFNNYLDDCYPLDGKVQYSKALFDQEPDTYEMLLYDYILEITSEEP